MEISADFKTKEYQANSEQLLTQFSDCLQNFVCREEFDEKDRERFGLVA